MGKTKEFKLTLVEEIGEITTEQLKDFMKNMFMDKLKMEGIKIRHTLEEVPQDMMLMMANKKDWEGKYGSAEVK